jgi:hypothetical protein
MNKYFQKWRKQLCSHNTLSLWQFFEICKFNYQIVAREPNHNNMVHLLRCIKNQFFERKKILFYPDTPSRHCIIYKMMLYLGFIIENNPKKTRDLAIHYWHGYDGNPFDDCKLFPTVRKNGNAWMIVNASCTDISKERVHRIFKKNFGYDLEIDPLSYTGQAVEKSNWNALHIGKIIECPVEKKEPNKVYERLIKNEIGNGFVEDMRVPVYLGWIPFVYLKYRKVQERFIDRANTNRFVTISQVEDVLTRSECKKIRKFCNYLRMDFGELDILRDRFDKHIYIIDANIAPSGPPAPIDDCNSNIAIRKLAEGFKKRYMLG